MSKCIKKNISEFLIDLSKYQLLKEIGHGGFGTVYTVKNKTNCKIYAAKVLYDDSNEDKKEILHYFNIFSEILHPSIIKFIGFSFTDFSHKSHPVIISEYLINGSLSQIFIQKKDFLIQSNFDLTKILIILYGIAAGMSFLHSKKIIHCDLKPENVLLDENCYPYIVDFGVSKDLRHDVENLATDSIYIAPEVLAHDEFSEKADIYSYGIMLYQIITKNYLFKDENVDELIKKRLMKLSEDCNKEDPQERPTFDGIIYQLQNDSNFITKNVNFIEYKNYVNMINDYSQKDDTKEECSESNEKNQLIEKVEIKDKEETQNSVSSLINEENQNKVQNETESDKKENPPESLAKSEQQKPASADSIKAEYKILLSKIKGQVKILKTVQKVSLISQGNYGENFIVKNKKNDEYAVKILYKDFDDYPKSARLNILKVVDDILSLKQHPTILKYIEFSPEGFGKEYRPALLTEYLSRGSLSDVIKNDKKVNPEQIELDICKKIINIYGIAVGMKYLHSCGIIHRDLKPSNILLDKNYFPKICDFAFSKDLTSMNTICKINSISNYSAPEVLKEGKYSDKSDVYAFGLLVYYIITSEVPFKNYSHFQLICEYMEDRNPVLNYDMQIPKELEIYKDLIDKCCSLNENNRPSFDNIVDILKKSNGNLEKYQEYSDYMSFVDNYDINNNFDQDKANDENAEANGNNDITHNDEGEKKTSKKGKGKKKAKKAGKKKKSMKKDDGKNEDENN